MKYPLMKYQYPPLIIAVDKTAIRSNRIIIIAVILYFFTIIPPGVVCDVTAETIQPRYSIDM